MNDGDIETETSSDEPTTDEPTTDEPTTDEENPVLVLTVEWDTNGFRFDVPPFPAIILAGIAWQLEQMAVMQARAEQLQAAQQHAQSQKPILVPRDHLGRGNLPRH